MTIHDIFFLLGGLGLFLYGISLMSEGLSLVAGPRLKSLLEKLTHNKWMGALLGFVVTAIIQSSTATTVMVIGFIDSALMTLSQATGVIMGANAGTTLTGILFTFNIQDYVPFIIFLGTMAMLFLNRKSFRHTGMALLGFGILFLGLQLMSTAMQPLRQSESIKNLFVYTQMPVIGLLVGFLVTALIQSSTASIAILLSMVAAGVVTDLYQAIFILYGFNVGTVVTVLIASIKANKASRQAAVVHVLFNVIGALIFTVLTMLPFGLVGLIQRLASSITMQLVYAHIIFNVATMLLLLPFSEYIVALAKRIITKGSDDYNELRLKYIDKRLITTPALEVGRVTKEINRMFNLVDENFKLSTELTHTSDEDTEEDSALFEQNRKIINYLHKEIRKYLENLDTLELDDAEATTVSICYKTINYLRRIQVLSREIATAIAQCHEEENCDAEGFVAMKPIIKRVRKILVNTHILFKDNQIDHKESTEKIAEIVALHEKVSEMTQPDPEVLAGGIAYTKVLSNLGRISSNATYIAKSLEFREEVEETALEPA